MKKVVLHIPHSSTTIPIRKGYLTTAKELKTEMIKLTDWYTNDLYQHKEAVRVVAPFSRLFCDVERFPEDKDERMAKFGMGMVYTTFDSGKNLRKIDKGLKNKIFNQYYQKHHNKLLQKVKGLIKSNGKCLIIDCHSFSNIPFERDVDKTLPRPNIDIGTDNFHTPKTLLNVVKKYLKKIGLSYKVNEPYTGTMVPLKYYKNDKRVQSIMIEVNRDLYLEKDTNIKNKNYKKIKGMLCGLIGEIIKEF